MDHLFLDKLDNARYTAGVSFVITSGFRCSRHNAAVGGVENSAHTKGVAADISATDSVSRFKIIEALIDVGFTRIGIAKTFVHVDMDRSKPGNVIWLY
jgi:uncharacterized protein YcbK (DUF882 family)